ncbi:MAG TPA: amidohydrolase, partial [Chitinophagaceae bacterium]
MTKAKSLLMAWGFMCIAYGLTAQPTFPENGVANPRHKHYAFTNATIVKGAGSTISNASMIIKDGKIVAIGSNLKVPQDAIEIDCKGKFIYPSFIDIYTDYGTPARQQPQGGGQFNFAQQPQLNTATKGAYGWNEAIKSDVETYKVFAADDAKAKPLREAGFGAVLTHVKDGIARGTGSFVTLADEKENLLIIKDRASAHYSFSKGTSRQSYPGSMMGMIALLRQTYLDAQWYKNK